MTYFGTIISDRQEEPKHNGITISAENTPRNSHCLRDGKYGKWDEFLLDILNNNLRIVQNKKNETNTEDEDDEEMPDDIGKSYVRERRQIRNHSNYPENDAIQIHMHGEITQGEETSLLQ